MDKILELLRATFCGEEISGVLFIRDYVEIQCEDAPKLQLFAPPRIIEGDKEFDIEDRRLAYKLLPVIGSKFATIDFDGEDYRFEFSNGVILALKRGGCLSGDTGAMVRRETGFAEF